MMIDYRLNAPVTLSDFTSLLQRSTLGERRPINDATCLQGMLDHSNLMVSAWQGETLVGISRCMTDFHYACYLSDLAVDQALQQQGIGKQLIHHTCQQLGPRCKLILLAAPAANDYYHHLGFSQHERCWVLEPDHFSQLSPSTGN